MTEIYIDGDACPVREEVYRVAARLRLKVFVVSSGSRPIRPPGTSNVSISSGQERPIPDKFASCGLAQSAARELGPKGIHIAHFVNDGGVGNARRPDPTDRPDSTLDPDAIAQTYLDVRRQSRSAWSLEVELRPWVETF